MFSLFSFRINGHGLFLSVQQRANLSYGTEDQISRLFSYGLSRFIAADSAVACCGRQLLKKAGKLITQVGPVNRDRLYRELPAVLRRITGKFRFDVVSLQNLGGQLLNTSKIADGLVLTLSALHLHINMLGVLLQNILLFLIFKDKEVPV